jgi:broad specificity phosphatase PhoE
MRHAEVAYFLDGRPVPPEEASLTEKGREQAAAAADVLRPVSFDRVITSGVPRALETAAIVAPGVAAEAWPELREIQPGRAIFETPEDALEDLFVGFFRDVVREDARFLGGEAVGELLDRVLPALDRLVADEAWDVVLAVLHGGVNRAILSHALTGGRTYLGNFEQAPACINVLDVGPTEPVAGAARRDWVVRAVDLVPYDLGHMRGRTTTMEDLWGEFRRTRSSTQT